MRTSLTCAVALAVLFTAGLASRPAFGQAQAGGTMVVVIDIPLIFKNHERFKAAINDIKKDIDDYKAWMTDQQKGIRAEAEKLEQFRPGTPEYKTQEEAIARKNVDLQMEGAKRQKAFMEAEAKVYYNTYKEIERAVEDFATRNSIQLVLRYSSEEIDATKRESIMQGINRAVVYQNRLDITDLIARRLNEGTPRQADTRSNPAVQPAIPGRTR